MNKEEKQASTLTGDLLLSDEEIADKLDTDWDGLHQLCLVSFVQKYKCGSCDTPLIREVEIADAVRELREALQDIIDECPEPKLPYGKHVVEIAQKALREGK